MEDFYKILHTWKTSIKSYTLGRLVWNFTDLSTKTNNNSDTLYKSPPPLLCNTDVETIAKFAQMEFKHGEPERGKTMFENILSNYPKRTDLWSVYVDMVIKTDDIEAVRYI